jgi:hypothetical protein
MIMLQRFVVDPFVLQSGILFLLIGVLVRAVNVFILLPEVGVLVVLTVDVVVHNCDQ